MPVSEMSESVVIGESEKDGVQAIEEAILRQIVASYQKSRGNMYPYWSYWSRMWRMHTGDYNPPGGPFADLYVPKMAPGIRRNVASYFRLTIPNRQLMDFFRFLPNPQDSSPELAQLAEAGVRNDLITGDFAKVYPMVLLDREITGNGYLLAAWEHVRRVKVERKVRQVYQDLESGLVNAAELEALSDLKVTPSGTIYYLTPTETIDGPQFRVVPRMEEISTPYLEMDAPRLKYVNPFSLCATEFDRHGGVPDCDGFFIYDAARFDDIADAAVCQVADDIFEGCYANIEQAELAQKPFIPTTMDYDSPMMLSRDSWWGVDSEAMLATAGIGSQDVLRLKRFTYFGRIDWPKIFRESGQSQDSAATAAFLKKFNASPREAFARRTWIIEVVNEQILVRCQPSYMGSDRLPLVHFRKWTNNFMTFGYGTMKASEVLDRIWNWQMRTSLHNLEIASDPPIEANLSLLDPKYRQMKEGSVRYEPGQVIPRSKLGASTSEPALRRMEFGIEPIQAARDGQTQIERELYEQAEIAKTAVGSPSGSNLATEVSAIAQAASDAQTEEAQALATNLGDCVKLIAELHVKFEDEDRMVQVPEYAHQPPIGMPPGEAGQAPEQPGQVKFGPYALRRYNVPPDAWFRGQAVVVSGPQTVADRQVQLAGFDKFTQTCVNLGRANPEATIMKYGELLLLDNPGAFIGPPPQPPPPPKRLAVSASVTGADMTPEERIWVLEEVADKPMPDSVKDGIIKSSKVIAGAGVPSDIGTGVPMNGTPGASQLADQGLEMRGAGPGQRPIPLPPPVQPGE